MALAGLGHSVMTTREPGGAPGAEILRDLLLSGETDWSPMAETMLHFAARAEHAARTIAPALADGTWVICDRFFDSTMAYQGFGQGADRGVIAALSGMIGLTPDLTIMLDVSEATAFARQEARGRTTDRYDRLGAGFHARVAEGFRAIAAAEPGRCVLIDANGPAELVAEAVLAAVRQRLEIPA